MITDREDKRVIASRAARTTFDSRSSRYWERNVEGTGGAVCLTGNGGHQLKQWDHRIRMRRPVINAGANDDVLFTDTEGRRRCVHRQVPARTGRDEIREAIRVCSLIEEWNGEGQRIIPTPPPRRVHGSSGTLARP